LRVLFLSNYYPPYEVGGYEQLCRDVAQRLAERGHAIHVLTSDRGVDAHLPAEEPGVSRILRRSPDFDAPTSVAIQFFFYRRRIEAENRQCLRRVVDQFKPDVISIWNIEGIPRSIALEAESLPGIGVAYWLAGRSPAEPDEYWLYWMIPALNPRIRPIKRLVGRLAVSLPASKPIRPQMCHTAIVSEYMRSKGIAEGTLPAHTRVLYNGVETEQFYRPVACQDNEPLKLLQAGRVSEDKGVHTAVEAIGHLANEHQIRNIHLSIAGSGPDKYLAFLKELVHALNIEEAVTFLGRLPRSAMPDLMAEHQVLLLPTGNQEPFARVVLEAMAGGLAVIGTLTGGTGELLQNGVTGLTFTAGDSHDLARQIRQLIIDPALRERIALRGQQYVLDRFTIQRMVDEIEELLQEAHTRHAGRPISQIPEVVR
jgi:glycogen(starch) synthase